MTILRWRGVHSNVHQGPRGAREASHLQAQKRGISAHLAVDILYIVS